MKQTISNVTLVVGDYDEAIDFFTKKLHVILLQDEFVPEQKKRWVVIAPFESKETRIVLGKASDTFQEKAIGN